MKSTIQRVGYSYIRFSTPDQAKGDSLRRQLEASEKFAEKHDIRLDTTLNIRDLGVSGFRGKNRTTGGLSKFIEAVETGRVRRGSFLLVESLDRLSRETINVALELFLNLINRGITVVTLIDQQIFDEKTIRDNPSALLMSIITMWRAYEESATKSHRVRQSAQNRRQNLEKKNSPAYALPGCATKSRRTSLK